jgi:hypothetical protein
MIKRVIIFSLFIYSTILCQSLGISAGYGSLNMNDVNKDLNDFRNLFSVSLGLASARDNVSGGIIFGGNFKYPIGIFNIGIAGNYISSSSSFSSSGIIEQNVAVRLGGSYDVSVFELLGLFEIIFPLKNSSFQPFGQLAGGVGFASAKRLYEFRIVTEPTESASMKNTVDGSYFAGRIKGGLRFVLQNIILEIAAGYRIADAGKLKGSVTGSGEDGKNKVVEDINGNAVEFDYSGFLITGGISIAIQ